MARFKSPTSFSFMKGLFFKRMFKIYLQSFSHKHLGGTRDAMASSNLLMAKTPKPNDIAYLKVTLLKGLPCSFSFPS